jgi:DNA-binding transcriptional ArsR family regulator
MDVVEVAGALSSPIRVKILTWLKDPQASFSSEREGDLGPAGVCVTLIARKAGISQPTASRHLEILRRTGLVRTQRIGQWNFHQRDEEAIRRAREAFDQI